MVRRRGCLGAGIRLLCSYLSPMRHDSERGSPSISKRDRGQGGRSRGSSFPTARAARSLGLSFSCGDADAGARGRVRARGVDGAWCDARRGCLRGVVGVGSLGEKKLKEDEGRGGGWARVLIPRESGAGPVPAPCRKRRSLNPGGPTPRPRLYF